MKKTTLALLLSAILSASATAEETQQQPNIVNITINNIGDDSGLEMGAGSRARGAGSIATGKNSVALGKNAVATGGNETKDSINAKLAENKQKLADIATAEANTNRLLSELQNIRKVEADVIEAGERVKQVRLAKQSAYNVWQEKLKTYNDTVAGSAQFLRDTQAKIDDLNSRLTGVSRIGNVDISSDEGLTNAATQLKSIAEEGTTLNLSVNFYKDYVSSYYRALGDLRQAYDYSAGMGEYFSNGSDFSNPKTALEDTAINPFDRRALLDSYEGVYTGIKFSNTYEVLSSEEYDYTLHADAFQHGVGIQNAPTSSIKLNSNAAITLETYQSVLEEAPKFKQSYRDYFNNTNNRLFSDEAKQVLYVLNDLRIDYYVKSNEIAYYQWEYERTQNTIWLDKKATARKELGEISKQFNTLKKEKNPYELLQAAYQNWKKENITDIEEKNKITTQTLTTELEKALGINKNAVAEKEAEIARLKIVADQAKSTYDNTNPSAADIALSQRYEEIMRQLTAKANELKSEQDRLQALRDALTLNDLTNVGENAYAIGTNTLATGTNSLAIGTDTIVTGENSIAIGKGSAVTGTNSIAIGTGHNVLGNNSGAFGDPDYIYGDDSYAFGNNNTIGEATNPHNSGNNTFVLGSNVVTKANNAVIIGANSTDGGDNTVSVGSSTAQRKIVYIANGAISQTSKDAINGSQIYDILQNATDINVASWQAKLGTGTNTAGNTGLITGDTLNAALSNVSAKLKVIAGTNTTVTTGTDGDYQTYAVNVSNDAIKAAIQTDLDSKANANASNITGDNKTKWQAALGDGKAEAGNTGLISGNTLHTALSTKADKTDITNINNTLNSKANTADVDTALAKKANTDASNLTTTNIQSWQEKLGTGTNTAGDKGLITGDTLHTALSTKADKTDITNINTALENKANSADVDAELAKKANIDASNINVTKFAEKLGTGIIEAGNTNLVTGGTVATALENKANTNLSNITNTAKTVIKNLAKDAVKVVKGTNTTVTTNTDGETTTYAVNVSNDAIKAAMQTDLDSKANANASNITGDNKTKWQTALGIANLNTTLDTKANTSLDNITSEGTTVIKNLAKDSVKVIAGTNTTVTTGTDGDYQTYAVNVSNDTIKSAIQSDLDTKANIDASNIDSTKFAEKLGTGTVSENDTNLVSGKTVYSAIQRAAINGADVSNKANRSANNLTAQDVENWQAKLGTNEVKANSKQLVTSGAVHSYVHDMNRNTLAQANTYTDMRINSLKQHTDKQIKRIKEETRAGIASAMAMSAIPTVTNKRYSVGAGTATFRGESAVAIGLRVKSDKDNAVVSFSASASSNGDIAGAAGFAFGF
ncbi:hypothetical protein QV08_00130 [Gallibacterium salpingitidis]|uniref:YadA-like family protein n=1 Tax=Gallibacterium salpingitidis TaxID=505341 RepID=UPI000805A749|nr:YadA-like family protein [Gallibacterium salpingitidis]OBX10098.1 hypothetical protein QV08_00130 [Gallibacterium salpingitidis]